MQVNALTITVAAIALCGVGLLLHDLPQSQTAAADPDAALRGFADAALELDESELVMRRALAQATTPQARVEARRALARLLERDWKLVAAERELQAALPEAEPPLEQLAQLDLARVRLKRGDLAGAREAAEAGERGPSAGDAQKLLGDIAKASGRYDAAQQHYVAARKKASDPDDVARIAAAECDLFQLERRLAPARQRCEQALSRFTIGHPERPATLKTLGLIYYFGGEAKRALGLHTRAQEGFAALGNRVEASWLREFAIDDEASLLENDPDTSKLGPLIEELISLVNQLDRGEETLWWRVSDARLRLADLYRKQEKYPDAERNVKAGQEAFESRPAGWQQIPDYATVFELAGLVAKDQGKLDEARQHLEKSLAVLEAIVGASVDVTYLKEEIEALRQGAAPQALEWSPL